MNRRHTTLPPAIAMGLVIVLAACPSPPGADDGAIEHPAGADEVVLRVSSAGGFVMPELLFSALPQFTLYGDGTVIVPGAVPAIHPGPALVPLQARRLSEEGIQTILRAVAGTGIFVANARFDGAQAMVADAPDTVFSLNADGTSVEVSIYALGFLDPANLPPGMPESEVAAHDALMDLSNMLSSLDTQIDASGWADDTWHPYQPSALRLSVRPADGDVPDGTETFVAWPIDGEDPATVGEPGSLPDTRCVAVTGEAAATWLETLSAANQSTRFTAGDHRYAVTPRLVLPDEAAACPAAG